MTRRLIVDADALAGLLEAATVARDPDVRQALAALVRTGTTPEPSPWCSVDDAARLLGVSPRTVRRAVSRGDLDHRRLGSRLLIARRAITGPHGT